MTAIIEPIFAGVVVALFNRYILCKIDPFASCSAPCVKADDDDECTSSANTSVTAEAGHVRGHL